MTKNNSLLKREDGYEAIVNFLDKYYCITKSDDAGSLLGWMMLIEENRSFDPAMQEDWINAWNFVVKNKSNYATIEQAYEVMILFLETYCHLGAEEEFITFVGDLKNKNSSLLTWQDWLNTIESIVNKTPRIRPYLELFKEE